MKRALAGLIIGMVAASGCSASEPENEDESEHLGHTEEDLFERRARTIFVTSATFTADLGGLAGADAKCQAVAEGIPALANRTFKAVLSDASSAVVDRFTDDGSFVRVDGVTVGSDFTQIFPAAVGNIFSFWWGSSLYDPILTENGAPASGPVRTGTTYQGKFEGADCAGFTTGVARGDAVKAGDPTQTNNPWLDATTIDCDVPAHLYCAEQ